MTYIIDVKTKFSPAPAGRLPIHGPDNGQRFRKEILLKALRKHDHVTVDFSGIATVGASFLNEAIAGLVWHDGFSEEEVRRHLTLTIPSDPSRVETAWAWVARAEEKRLEGVRPKGRRGNQISSLRHASA